MKRTYKSPYLRVAEIDTEMMMASSPEGPQINGGPAASPTSITDDNKSDFIMEVKGQGAFDNEW